MLNLNRCAKINVKVLIILIVVTVALGASLFAARHIRRNILSEMSLRAGEAAFENKDWQAAYRNFREYLGRNPDDIEILKKYAEAALSIRPLDAKTIGGAIAAYRRVMQLDPLDKVAYDKLAMLYAYIGNFEELAYIARTRLENDPNDLKARLSVAEVLIRLNKMEEAQEKLTTFIDKIGALPDKHDEYVRACLMMSKIILDDNSTDAKTKALEYINRAVDYAPESVEALASRARFYRVTTNVSDPTAEERLAAARKDLEMADDLNTENPRILLFLAEEWIAHGELNRATAELRAAESLPQETLEEHFFDLNNWTVARFLLASELTIRRAAITEDASLADEALTALKEKRHRVRVLPFAIRLYVIANKTLKARECLDEYFDILHTQQGQAESRQGLVYLRALVAKAEDDSYAVIDALQPAIMSDASRPELWGLLAEAFIRTEQTRRAVSALIKYLRLRPQDAEMRQQLTKEYLKLRDWSNALKTAQLAESLNPTEIVLKLLRIEASINITAQQQEMTTAKRQALADEANELAQLRKEHPDSVDIRILQAIIAIYLDDSNTAERELKMAIDECEESLRAEMQLFRLYYRTKRIAEAISTCQNACEDHPEVAEPWLSLSGLHVANADYDSARSCLRRGLDTVVDQRQKRSLSISLALLELVHGDRATGIGLLSELVAQDEQEVRARSLLLGIREVQEDQARVQELINEIRKTEGESGLLWRLYQASLWLSSDDWRSKQPDIVSYLQYCINSDPEWSSPPLLLVEMYEKLEDFRRVEDICRQALVRNPSATDIANKLLTLLERQGRFSEAEKVLQQIETDPQVASTWHVRMALRAGDFSRAIEELKLRVSNDDQDAASRIQLARLVYQQTGDADQAFAYLKEAEAITPDSMALTAARVSILKAEGQAEEAQRILNDYVANSDVFGAYVMRAAYLANEGEFERAEQDYRKLTTFAEQGAIGYELLSNFYGRNEKLDKAVEALEEGLDAYPEDLRLKRRLMKTLFLQGPAQDRPRALEILTALEEQLPQDPELMKFRTLQILEESTPQSFKDARGKLENVIKLEPTAVDAHLLLIGIAMQQGDYETARDSAIRAAGSNPNNLALLLTRGRAELELGNIQMAVELANLVLQKDPTNTGALGVLLDSAIRSGNNSLIEDATALARLMLEEDPNKIEVRDVIVTKAVESKDRSLLEEARTLLESALGSNPTDEKLLISRARVLVAMDLPQDAIPELKAYCQTKEGSSSVAAIVTLADLYRLSGDMDQAEQRIEQAEQIAPNSLTVIHARFLWLAAQNRFEELVGISSAYLSAKEQNPTTLIRAATVLASLDSMALKKEGLKLYEHAVTLSPTSKDARLGLAFTLYQTGNAERAEKIYQELLEQYPNNIQILNDLAWILQEHYQRYADALELANRAISLAPDNLYVLDTRGTILSNLVDRLADARDDFEKLVELSLPDSRQRAKALLQLGRIYVKLNDLVQAKQHLQNALEIDRRIDVFTPDERSEITRIVQRSGIQTVNK
ncbi:MAG TPA: tetratricopeptide repeat protein [Sedimentisphaerales bacterium]|nr:tetratricopeptide repeat protein [Sedimentisphaerales bacterium]